MLIYPIKVIGDDNDTFYVLSPDFPELKSLGDNFDDALKNALGAFEEAIAARIAYREVIPAPSHEGEPV